MVTKKALTTIPLPANTDNILERTEQSKIIANMLSELREDDQQLLTYYYFDGLSTSEITKEMGFANDFVTRNKKSRILKKLRKMLEESKLLKDLFF